MKVLWGRKADAPAWDEEVITEATDNDCTKIEKAKAWAISQGFVHFRVATFSDTPEFPDFAKTINM